MGRQHTSIDHHRIANLAYSYWQARGRPLGSSEEDWFKAEAALDVHERLDLPLLGVNWGPDEGPWC